MNESKPAVARTWPSGETAIDETTLDDLAVALIALTPVASQPGAYFVLVDVSVDIRGADGCHCCLPGCA